MSSTTSPKTLIQLPLGDPVTKFVVDGGSWGDAMILQSTLDIPVLEARILAAAKKQNPSGERYRAKLVAELAEAYSWVPGKTRKDAEAFHAAALAAAKASKAQAKAGPATPANAKATPKDAWVLLDMEDE